MGRRRFVIGVIAGVAGCGALPGPAAGAAADTARARTPYVALSVLSHSRATVLRTRAVRVRVISVIPASVSVTGVARLPARTGRRAVRRTLVFARRTILPARRARILTLRLTPSGLRALRDCGAVTVELAARGVRLEPLKQLVNGRRQSSRLVTRAGRRVFRPELGSCRGGILPIPGPGGFDARSGYFVGLATRSINPQPNGTFAGKPVYLGGYGIASPPVAPGRPATGILRNGVSVRAIAISDGRRASAIADIEAQGWFVANKDAPLGLVDMRREVQRRTNGALPASAVVIQSDHSHSGPDFMGVWGGVPLEYRRFVFDRTVEAIVAAYTSRREGTLYYGSAPARDLLANQFDADPANQAVDSDVRVLQARDAGNRAFATLLNFSAHATVLGGDNTKASGDWIEAANPLLERRFGGAAMTMVGTLGRTQPADRGCSDPGLTGDARSICTLDAYAGRVVDRAGAAVDRATAVPGDPVVAARSYLLQDPATSVVLLGLAAGGDPAGAPLNRALTPPWLTANVLGTLTASLRFGDVLLSTVPGEAYPQIPLAVRAALPSLRGYMTAGLAGDQLGYLIGPFEAYPEPIRRTLFNQRGDEISPIDNDNYAFNVSHTIGERVTCSLLRGAGELFARGTAVRDAAPRCALFANDAALGPGADTTSG